MPTAPAASEIERALLTEISGMFPEVTDITAATPLQQLGLDSLRLFGIFVLIENQFGLRLLDGPLTREMLENISSLAAETARRLAAEA